jgi:hypothetical protein
MALLAVSVWGLAPASSSIEVLARPNQAISLPGDLRWEIQNYHTVAMDHWASYFQEPDDDYDEMKLPLKSHHHRLTRDKKTHRSATAICRSQKHCRAKERYYLKWKARNEEYIETQCDVSMYWHTEYCDYENRPYRFWIDLTMVFTQADVVKEIGFSDVGWIIPTMCHTLIAEFVLLSEADIPRLINTSDAHVLPNELRSLIIGYS